MTERTLLILGAGPDQLPSYRAARRLGCRVVGVDRNAAAPGAALADRFLHVSVRDAAGVVKRLGGERVDGVIAPATDASQPTLQTLADYYETPWRPSTKAALASVDKGFFRQVLQDLPYPRCGFAQSNAPAELLAAAGRLRWPLMVKPADGSGCKGLTSVTDHAKLPGAIERAQRMSFSGEVIVEELIDGRHLSVEAFMVDGCPVVVGLSDRGNTGAPCWLTITHLLPAPVDDAATAAVTEMVERVCRALKHDTGPVIFDLVLSWRGEVHPIEFSARMGGNGMMDLVAAAYGIDIPTAAIQLALGRPFSLDRRLDRVAMLRVLGADRRGTLTAVEGAEAVMAEPTTAHLEIYPPIGAEVGPYTAANAKLGLVVYAAGSHADVVAADAAARRRLRLVVREHPPAADATGPATGPGAAVGRQEGGGS